MQFEVTEDSLFVSCEILRSGRETSLTFPGYFIVPKSVFKILFFAYLPYKCKKKKIKNKHFINIKKIKAKNRTKFGFPFLLDI